MRQRLAIVVSVGLIVSAPVRGEEDARAVIDRAIQAMGGEALLARAQAFEVKMEGAVHSEGPLPFHAIALVQLPDQFKHSMEYERGGRKVSQVQVYHGQQVSIRIDGSIISLDAAVRTALLKGRFADYLTQLTVLKNKEYQLSSLGESKQEGKPVVGIKVTARDRPEVQLFFDKGTGLLVKTEHRQLDPRTREEVIQEVYYSDYQVLDTTAADEKVVKAAGFGTSARDLLEFFRKRGRGGDARREKIAALIAQLGDDAFDRREQATADLIAIGADAVPFLKAALKQADLEVVRRAEACLKKIGMASGPREDPRLPAAAARLLGAKKPAGAAEALLDYILAAPDDVSAREARAALARVAVVDARPDRALLAAAASKDAGRRTVAEEALGRVPLPPGRKILLEGLKRPTKVAVYRAGRKFMEWQVREISYFNKIEEKRFTLP